MRYSVGDKVVIGAGRHGHGFNIGDTVEIFQVGNINYDCRGEGSRTWLIESAYKETTLDELYAIDNKKTITIGGHKCEIRKDGLYNKDVGLVSLQVMNIVDRATGVDTHSVVGEDVKIGVEYNFKVGCSTFTREDLKKAIRAVEDANS